MFYAVLDIEGSLANPTVTASIEYPADEGNDQLPEIQSALARVNADKASSDKQAFGLILLNGFILDNFSSTSVGEITGLSGSFNDLISKQLNNLAGRYIRFVDLEFGVDSYESDSESYATDFSIGLRKSFFDDRLTIQVDGVATADGNREDSRTGAYIKDVILEYKLTKDGRLKLKVYSEQDFDEFAGSEDVKSGTTLIFSKDFGKRRKK